LIGVYSLNNNVVEIFIMIAFGVIGFLMRKTGFEGAPFILALVLGPIMETSLRQSLIISRGSFAIFFSRPVAAVLIVLAFVFLLTSLLPALKIKRAKLAAEMGR
jgi:putative tricarboxylic transport membrane protein